MIFRFTGFRFEICFLFCIFWFYLLVGEGNKKLSKVFFFKLKIENCVLSFLGFGGFVWFMGLLILYMLDVISWVGFCI